MDALRNKRVVMVHDWLTGMRGGEKVLEVFCRQWPDALLYTLFHQPGTVSDTIAALKPRTSWLQWLPKVHRYYRYLLPLMPSAVNWLLPECDLVLSSSHCVAKGVQTPAGVPHICYCYTPMRYAWHMRESYGWRGIKGWCIDRLLARIRRWDQVAAQGVTHFVAISKTIQQRIRDCYKRDSVVIYPPVDTDFYTPATVPRDDYYLLLSAMAPYKRHDLAIQACNALGKKLVVIGSGQEERRLKAMAGPTIHFLGWQSDAVLLDHLRRCKALLFPGEEDFGIVPVEAMACGTPVIALGKGGASETVLPLRTAKQPTGVWHMEQTAESLIEAMQTFEAEHAQFDPAFLRRHACHFHTSRFADEFARYTASVLGVADIAPALRRAS